VSELELIKFIFNSSSQNWF